jgi:hypothetical protein
MTVMRIKKPTTVSSRGFLLKAILSVTSTCGVVILYDYDAYQNLQRNKIHYAAKLDEPH